MKDVLAEIVTTIEARAELGVTLSAAIRAATILAMEKQANVTLIHGGWRYPIHEEAIVKWLSTIGVAQR